MLYDHLHKMKVNTMCVCMCEWVFVSVELEIRFINGLIPLVVHTFTHYAQYLSLGIKVLIHLSTCVLTSFYLALSWSVWCVFIVWINSKSSSRWFQWSRLVVIITGLFCCYDISTSLYRTLWGKTLYSVHIVYLLNRLCHIQSL